MAAPWTRHYDPEVPPSLAPYPAKTLVDYLRETAAVRPGAPAILFKGRRISNAELDRLSDRFAASLVEAGVGRGDRVALLLPNSPQFLIAEFGAWKAGATVLPLNPLYTGSELREPLKTAGIEVLVTLTPFYRRLKEIQRDTPVRRIVATSIKEYLPPLLRVLFTLFKEKKEGHRIELEPGDVWFQDCVNSGAPVVPAGAGPSPDDPAIMLMSGGTTGLPKAVVGLHRCLVAAGLQLTTWLHPPAGASSGATYQDIALVPLPLFHVYACVGVQSHSIVSRTPMALVPNPRDIADLLKTIETVRPTLFSGVPALFIALLNHPKVRSKSVDFRSIRACFSGAAPLMAATKAQFEELTGGRIVEGYSLTEAMMACVVNPLDGVNKVGSVGIPLPDVEVAIVDTGSGTRFLANGETGEIVLRAPQLMTGYFNNAHETTRSLRVHPDAPSTASGNGPWLHTGDLGYLDEDFYLFIVDRQKDLIKTSGYQVWPREIEEVLASHPSVQEVGVAGIPDEIKGEVVKAWIVKRAGTNPTIDELRTYCRQHLAPYKTPAYVEFRDSLPKTMAGKVLRRILVEEDEEALGSGLQAPGAGP
ncbi:MAG: AMP-dependent synthetase [Acidobacteria bacterium]|nr:MAG: AMP-dependent synthetase [Acidobacteriota bacterium]